MKNRFIGALCLGLCIATHCSAVVYVDASKPGGNGTAWAQAYKTIEAAVAASGNNAEIWVAKGTYAPANPLGVKQGTLLYGGFAGTETQLSQRNVDANLTVIDSQLNLRHAIYISFYSPGVRIDGFTIMRGRARPGTGWDEYGGGIMIDGQPATVANCTFTNNGATYYGGAVMANRAACLIQNCKFYSNYSQLGGGVAGYDADMTIEGCTFYRNAANIGQQRGGAIWANLNSPVISNCVFTQNSALQLSGAVEISLGSGATVANCTFFGNTSVSAGGAIGCVQASGTTVRDCTFDTNTSGDNGGGICSYYSPMTISRCTFYHNSAAGGGGGVQLDYNTAQVSLVERCKFVGNTAGGGGGLHSYAQRFRAENCIFDSNSAGSGGGILTHAGNGGDYDSAYSAVIASCVVYGNSATDYGGGMINSFAPNIYLYNSIFAGNSAGITLWDPGQSTFVTSKDIFNAASSSLTTRQCDIETLNWYHASVSENHTGSFTNDPRFVDANGPDDAQGTLDDDFRLQSSSPCLDRGDGNNAPSQDIVFTPRFDLLAVANTGIGSPTYVDIGAYESIQYAATPTFSPVGGGVYTTFVTVVISSSTTGSTIRYTTDGSTPTASSAVGSNITIGYTTTLKARAYATGFAESDEASATYTMVDSDADGLPNWVETGTGTYANPTNTGTSSTLADTDGDTFKDGFEVQRGSDPNDPDSRPEIVKNDFDGDGRTDLGCYFPPGGNWYFMKTTDGFSINEFGFTGTLPVNGDFDGDGKSDYGCYFPTLGNWYFMKTTDGFSINQFGYAGTLPITGDFDGDGKTDYGCYFPPEGKWYIMQSTAGFVINEFGYLGTLPITGDFDGDGKTDYGCYHPVSGNWYLMQTTAGFVINQFGFVGTLPITGDFDGDGKTDYGCYHPLTGNWYMMQSRDGFVINQFGYEGTEPITGDYDGDGKTDYGCYFAPEGKWYIMQTSAGFAINQFGYLGTIPLGKDVVGN